MNRVVRTIDDLDILIEDSDSNVHLLPQTLKFFGEGHASELSPADFLDKEEAI